MSIRRSKLDIYLEILKAIKEGTNRPTRIMYKTNISWSPALAYLKALQDIELIEVTTISRGNGKRSARKYSITEKGESVLNYFYSVQREIGITFQDLQNQNLTQS